MQTEDTMLGPVDVALLAFPDGVVSDRIAGALAAAVSSGAARLLDALLVEKDAGGTVTVTDVEQYGDSLEIIRIPGQLPGLLSETDVDNVSGELAPGSAALLVAWENIWAVRLRQAVHDSGGVVVLHERVGDAELADAVQHVTDPRQA